MNRTADTSTWADYRRRIWTFRGLLYLGLVAVWCVAVLYYVERIGIHGLLWPLLAWAALIVLAGVRLQGFRCPRCTRHFFRRKPLLLALRGTRCVNCMLPKE